MAEAKKKTSLKEQFIGQARLVSVVLSLIILVSSYFLLISPLIAETAAGGRYDLKLIAAETEAAERRAAEAKALAADAQQLSVESRLKLATALPREPDTASIVAALDAFVKDAGMNLVSVDAAEQKEGVKGAPEIGLLNVTMTVSGGDYPALKALVTSLEHSLRLIDIATIVLNPRTANYTFGLRAYYYRTRPPAAATAIGAPTD
ncbi:hypothetical protein EPN90_01120 [Patescibacteria group bacterium]|nr:MAG: hypothetical protein EPN90_01120 [Patescibacteria group bacterium]